MQLFVVDAARSPQLTHVAPTSTGTVSETVSGIGPGSPLLYILYASTGDSGCHTAEQHRRIFDAAVAALHPCSAAGGVGGGEGAVQNFPACMAADMASILTSDGGEIFPMQDGTSGTAIQVLIRSIALH